MENRTYKISDIYLTATLMTLGFAVASVERYNGQRVLFCFADDPELVNIQEQFYRDELRVNPRQVCRNLKELKRLMYGPGRER